MAMFGQTWAYSALSASHFFEPRLDVGKDRFRGAFRLADTAVDAFVRVDYQHVVAFVEAVDRADLHAIHVFATNAIVGDDEGHDDTAGVRGGRFGEGFGLSEIHGARGRKTPVGGPPWPQRSPRHRPNLSRKARSVEAVSRCVDLRMANS
jgi:hypothetical protein